MDKLGITFDDVRAAQKNAAKKAQEKAPAPQSKNRPAKKPKQLVIRNTGTAMGAALAAALAGSDIAIVDDTGRGRKEKNQGTAASNGSAVGTLSRKVTEAEKKKLAEELGIGEITLTDILSELEKPSRDPRESMPAPILRSDVLDMKDLKPGMILKGTVRNVIDFGCFVDIGVHQDGLVHISHITDKYIRHPLEAVSVGDIVDVQVLDVELDKKRISLTMKLQDPAKVAAEAAAKAAQRSKAPSPRAENAKLSGSSSQKRTSVIRQVADAAGVDLKAAAAKTAAPRTATPGSEKTKSAASESAPIKRAPSESAAPKAEEAVGAAKAPADAPKKFK